MLMSRLNFRKQSAAKARLHGPSSEHWALCSELTIICVSDRLVYSLHILRMYLHMHIKTCICYSCPDCGIWKWTLHKSVWKCWLAYFIYSSSSTLCVVYFSSCAYPLKLISVYVSLALLINICLFNSVLLMKENYECAFRWHILWVHQLCFCSFCDVTSIYVCFQQQGKVGSFHLDGNSNVKFIFISINYNLNGFTPTYFFFLSLYVLTK